MFQNKLVAVINKDLEQGRAMNALAHMSVGLGAKFNPENLELDDYIDAENNRYPNISRIPFIILKGKSSEIRKLLIQAREEGITHGVFLDTMIEGSYQEQLDRTKNRKEGELVYFGCTLFGPWDKVSGMTRKLSFWK